MRTLSLCGVALVALTLACGDGGGGGAAKSSPPAALTAAALKAVPQADGTAVVNLTFVDKKP